MNKSRINNSKENEIEYSFLQTQNNYTNTEGGESGTESESEKPNTVNRKNDLILISDAPLISGPPTRTHWKQDKEVKACSACARPFTFINRRHHCRRCGDIFCNQCASYTYRLDRNCEFDSKGVLSRVCKSCYNIYQKELISLIRESDVRFKSRANTNSLYSREYNNNYIPRNTLHSSNTTANIPIIRNQQDTTPATLLSVPSDWSWSTF